MPKLARVIPPTGAPRSGRCAVLDCADEQVRREAPAAQGPRPPRRLPPGAVLRLHQARARRRRDASSSARRATPRPPWTRSWPRPRSPRARSTTTSAASRRCSRRSSSASRRTRPPRSRRRSRASRTPGRSRSRDSGRSSRVVQDPTYRRVVIQEGPSVLGYERFREQEGRSSFAIVLDIVQTVLSAGPLRARRADGGDVQPDLLRRHVERRRERLRRPRTPRPPASGWRRRSGSS